MQDGAAYWPQIWFLLSIVGAVIAVMGSAALAGIITTWRVRGFLATDRDAGAAALNKVKEEVEADVQALRDEFTKAMNATALAVRDLKDELIKAVTDSRHDLRAEVFARVLLSEGKLDQLLLDMTRHTEEDRGFFRLYGERIARLEPPDPVTRARRTKRKVKA